MIEQSENINELATALAKAQGKITGALKDSANPFFKSKYADLASVWEACRDQLAANGLAVVQVNGNDNDRITVTTMLVHGSGQWIRGVCSAKPAKDDAQATGSVITYLRRYGLAAITGVAQVDDDANAATGKKPEVTSITNDVVDPAKIDAAVAFFKEKIEEDNLHGNWELVQAAHNKLSNNERMVINGRLDAKANNSNKSYRTILKEYLNYVPTEGIAK